MNLEMMASSQNASDTVVRHHKRRLSTEIDGVNLKRPRAVSPNPEIWTPLDKESRQIRLATLEPSTDLNAQAVVSLEMVSLDDAPQYQALSYAWGDANLTKTIDLQGIQWPVTVNLEAALRYLRYPAVARVIWIDAICINQSSINERNHQVQLMKSIYSMATVVRVWLGEGTLGSCEAMQIVQQIAESKSIREMSIAGSPIVQRHLLNAIEYFKRPWWSRIWALQEVVLAREVTIHCGHSCSNNSTFEAILHRDWDFLEDGWIEQNIKYNVHHLFKTYFHRVFQPIDTARTICQSADVDDRYNERIHFIRVLGNGRFSRSSDPRDSIYGLLGLADNKIARRIVPDYSISPSDTFINFAIQLTLLLQSLLLFSLAGDTESRTIETPSWAPTWEHLAIDCKEGHMWNFKLKRIYTTSLFSTSRNYSMNFTVIDRQTVKASGFLLSRVAHKSSPSVAGKDFPDTFKVWRHFFHANVPRGISDPEVDYTKLMMNDTIQYSSEGNRYHRRCLPEDIEESRKWLKDLEMAGSLSINNPAWNMMRRACAYRRLFVTRNGYAGLGPIELEVGDLVYILAGGSKLYILRPVPGASHPRNFNLIGDCYVQGVMDGEAVEDYENFHNIYLE